MSQQTNQQTLHKYKNILILLLLLVTLGLGAIIVFRKDGITMEQYNAIQDSLHTSRDENGRQTAVIQDLRFDNERAFTKLKTNDSTVKWLQNVVKDFRGQVNSAVVAALQTMDIGGTRTEILPGDIVRIKDTIKLYPRYKTTWKEKWSQGDILATKDSIFRNIKIINEWDMVIGKPNKGLKYLFKSPEFDVSLTNNNPNTVTKELRSFTVKNKQKRLGIGFSSGVCVNNELKPGYFVGFSVNYNIIEIW